MESQKHSVVIVEDEGLIAADLQGRLEKVGYLVPAVAGTAGAALEAIREKSPDLILMDIRLQGNVDGIQVAEQVRQHFDIPVVYLTAYEDRQTLERASLTQAFGYIKKPVDSASLQASIEMAISKHRHERYLREQRDWFRASFAAIPDAILVADTFGRICYLNPVAEKMLGTKAGDALGKPASELLRLKHRNGRLADDLIAAATLQATAVALPHDISLEDGTAIQGSIAPRWRDGRADGVVVSFKDVSLRQFEEEQTRNNSRHDALSRMADGIAGHLDLELSVIAEETIRLLNQSSSGSSLHAAAEAIESAALDALGVTSSLRAFGQPLETKPQMVQVHEIFEYLEKAWGEILPELSVQLDPAARRVHANRQELTRCLDMFLQHAHRSQNRRHPVTLEASSVKMAGLDESVCIRISYTSANEDRTALDRVFDPSWDGNWHGLPLAYGLIRRMGGLSRARMLADNKVAFDIYLASVDVAAAGASIEEGGERVILIIEPNAPVRRMLRDHFQLHGYSVLQAESCNNALALAQQFGRTIQLAIANPARDDPDRQNLTARLMDLKPGICVREIGLNSAPELLDWANNTIGVRALTAAG